MPKCIVLNTGNVSLVDDDVWEWASCYRWSEHTRGYATRHATSEGKGEHIFLHRAIMRTPKGMDTDHIDHDKLNNLRSNLRIVTHSQNAQNRAGAQNNSRTGIRGVRMTAYGDYQAEIRLNRKTSYLGTFRFLVDADTAAQEGRRRYFSHSPECKERERRILAGLPV